MVESTVSAAGANRGRLVIVFAITTAFMVIEVVGGLLSNSLALIADAGHMFTDVFGLGLALVAIHLAARPATNERTFGWYRLEILAAALNAVLLFGVAAFILFEAWRRWSQPPDIESGLMLAVAIAGLVANAFSLWLLRQAQAESLNMRGAFLEVLSDLLGSAAVVVAAAVIAWTGFERADAIASAIIGLLILPRTWSLLREAVDILLEATPKGVDMQEVRRHMLGIAGVADVHDVHAWTITSGMNVLAAHVVLQAGADASGVLERVERCLADDFDIEHSTVQLETHDRQRIERQIHA